MYKAKGKIVFGNERSVLFFEEFVGVTFCRLSVIE